MMRESVIEKKVTEFAKARGWMSIKLNGQHNRGKPDRMYLKEGNLIFIEFKASGQRPTKLQAKSLSELEAQGFSTHVIDSVEKGKEVFCA